MQSAKLICALAATVLLTGALPGTVTASAATPQFEDYGSLPEAESMVISPDGKHYAFIQRAGDETRLLVYNTEQKALVGGSLLPADTKGHYVRFATNNYVLFRASQTIRRSFVGQFEFSGAYAFSIRDNKTQLLLSRSEELYPNQSGIGSFVGVNAEDDTIYMPAYSDRRETPLDLYRVDLKTGRGRRFGSGRAITIDWFVSAQGELLAREDLDSRRSKYAVYSYVDGKPKKIFTRDVDQLPIGILGVDTDEKHLLFRRSLDDNRAVFRMSLDTGEISGPVFAREGVDVSSVELNVNRKMIGVMYGGLKPVYDFVDDQLDQAYERMSRTFEASSIFYSSSTADLSTHIFEVSGADRAKDTLRIGGADSKMTIIGRGYPGVATDTIADIEPWIYNARDGLEIPSVLTWPVGITEDQRKNLPLIVMPHGGPAAHDTLSFDWWSQYFAARGYMILQPNFRGSTGFGIDHQNAGDGEWGKKMQHDVTDGVRGLIDSGIADEKRVCIMGASYGGYAALAGGAFTPDLYRCVVAFAPVSDIPRMLNMDVERYGRNHWAIRYWADIVGDRKEDKEELKAYSPVHFAENFTAPVLLLHGRKDTVVPFVQSRVMSKALKRAKKPVELVTLDGEDHWLSSSTTRQDLLREIDEFLARHNPPN